MKFFSKREDCVLFVRHEITKTFKRHFIPCDENEYSPHSLRLKALLHSMSIVFLVKVIATITLFTLYPSPGILVKDIPEHMLELINQTRNQHQIHTVENNAILALAAKEKAKDMLEKSYFSHTAPDGKTPWEFIDRARYWYMAAGENLAMGFTSPETAHEAFLESASHRQIILNDRYNEVGIAGAYGTIHGKETTVLVEFFGSTEPKSQYLLRKEKSTEEKSIPYISKKTALREDEGDVAGEKIEMEELNTPSEILISVPETNKARAIANKIITIGNILLSLIVLYLSVAFLLNLFIHIRIQRPKIIIQSLLVLSMSFLLLFQNAHFLENLIEKAVLLS